MWEGAAEQGDADAQFTLGVMYRDGHGVGVNYKKSMEWFETVSYTHLTLPTICSV